MAINLDIHLKRADKIYYEEVYRVNYFHTNNF